MEPVVRASLATLAALAILGGLSALVRAAPDGGEPAPAARGDRLGMLLQHGVALGAAVAALLGSLFVSGADTRPLLLCATGPLFVVCVPSRIAWAAVPSLFVLGIAAYTLDLVQVAGPAIVGTAAASIAVAAYVAGVVAVLVRRRRAAVPRARALLTSVAAALVVAAAGALSAVATGFAGAASALSWGASAWAIAIGAAGAVATAARLRPGAPPGEREIVAAAVMFSLVLAVSAAAALGVAQGLFAALWASLVSLGVYSLLHATLERLRTAPPAPREPALDASLPPAEALGAMVPLLDDALLRRPARPRVIARVPARRLLDAALDRAKSAQPRGSSKRDDVRVDVVSGDSDIDIDGDPVDLAEALCAVLDNALRSRAQHPDIRVQVHLRGSPAAVTFEISDVLPEGAAPIPGAGIPDADAPFLHPRADVDRPGLGVSLARARVLVERNGGKLLTRSSAEGSTVQVTMPRRMQKGAVGQA